MLNAKFHELEAEIVAEAGHEDSVTIATNMAGRGTDIKLGEGVRRLGGLKIIGTERHESDELTISSVAVPAVRGSGRIPVLHFTGR